MKTEATDLFRPAIIDVLYSLHSSNFYAFERYKNHGHFIKNILSIDHFDYVRIDTKPLLLQTAFKTFKVRYVRC